MSRLVDPLHVRVERALRRERTATARVLADGLGERATTVHGVLTRGLTDGWCHVARFDGAASVFAHGRANGPAPQRRTRPLAHIGSHVPRPTVAEPDAAPWSDYGLRVLGALDAAVAAADAARDGMRDICAFIEGQPKTRKARAA